MFNSWLQTQQRDPSPSTKFQVNDFIEHGDKNDESVKSDLKQIFIQSSVNLDLLKSLTKKYGWDKSYELFVASGQPSNRNMAKGRFGEILLVGVLKEFFDYIIPIHKLQYTITKNQTLPSTDILAIKATSEISEMCFVESKLRIVDDINAPVIAYQQLMEDQTYEIPDIIKFAMNRLADKNDPLVDAFILYLLEPIDVTIKKDVFRIGVIYEKEKWNEKSFEKLDKEITGSKRIYVDLLKIEGLQSFVENIYQYLGVTLDGK